MKISKLFLAGMYIHLILSVITPVGILMTGEWGMLSYGLFFFYLFMIGVVHILGWISAASAMLAYRKGRGEQLRNGMKTLKLCSIPFYLLNFAVSFVYWFLIVMGSRGTLFFLLPIPIAVTCLMIFQSGWVGVFYIMYLRKQPENQGKPSGIHYLLQMIPVLDVVSAVSIMRKFGK